jgi:glycosyltransferase involved in cell wall biosynthesis
MAGDPDTAGHKDSLRIAHIALTALPATVGGLGIVADSLIRHQRALGHDVSLITRWRPARIANEARIGYPVLALPPNLALSRTPFRDSGPRWPVELALFWHQLRQRFDVMHAHWLYPTGWMAARPLRALGVPMVMTAHGADVQTEAGSSYGYRQFPENERRLRVVAAAADAATAISPNIARSLGELGVAADRIHAIPNGVDFARFERASATRAAVRERLGLEPDTKMILSVGRNQPSKGFAIVPEVLARLRRAGHDVFWCIVGPSVGELQAAFAQAGMADHVHLYEPAPAPTGATVFPSDELLEFYGAADIFGFPSLTEGAPLVLLEAMAAGLPVVGNDVQGIRDAVVHQATGLLTTPGDAASMATQIARLLHEGELARKLAQAGQEQARLHDWSAIAGQYCDLYRKLVA